MAVGNTASSSLQFNPASDHLQQMLIGPVFRQFSLCEFPLNMVNVMALPGQHQPDNASAVRPIQSVELPGFHQRQQGIKAWLW